MSTISRKRKILTTAVLGLLILGFGISSYIYFTSTRQSPSEVSTKPNTPEKPTVETPQLNASDRIADLHRELTAVYEGRSDVQIIQNTSNRLGS